MAEIDERKTADGSTRYDVRFRVNGKQRKKTFRVKKDATNYLKTLQADEVRGLVLDPQGGELLFGPYAAEWIKCRLVKGEPLTPATRQGYEKLLRRTINPTFDKTRLRQITPPMVRKWQAELTAQRGGNGGDQAAKSYRLLRAILNTAVSDELIPRNPCSLKGAGIERARERPMLETAEVLKLANAITPRLRCLVLLGGLCGLRPGELLGLQRQDIDLLHNSLSVTRQAHEIKGQGRIYTGPKTEAGKRTQVLPAPIPQLLSDHLEQYVAAAPDSPVFTRPSGLPLRRADLSEAWRDACAAVGITDVHPHDLRHSGATTMARNPNITTKELMAWGGWATPTIAMRYQHATAERAREHATYLEGVIAAAESSSTSAPVPLHS